MHSGKVVRGNSKKLISRINAFTSVCVYHTWCAAFCLTVKSSINCKTIGWVLHFASGECFLNFVLLLLFLHSLLRLVIQGLYSWSGDDRRACVWCTIVIQYHAQIAHCCIIIQFDVAW